MPRLPGFIGPSYTSQSIVAADDQCINWIPAKIESGTGAAPWVFDPAPGFGEAFATATGPGWRASYELNNLAYAIIGGELMQVTLGPPAITHLVTIGGSAANASLTANGEAGHQVMTANGDGRLDWYDTVANTNGQITSVEGHVVAFMNSYFIALNTDTSTIFVSAPNDGTSWDPLDAAQRNDFPDKWQTMIVRLPDLLLFGRESISVYYNDPNNDFPFVPNTSIAITRGIRAPASLKILQGNPIWLADDLTVRYMTGYTPVRVSNHALEYAISQMDAEDLDIADAFTYNEQGHSFYVLNFPDVDVPFFGGTSWAFDLTTGMWHRRGPYDSDADDFTLLRVNHAMVVNGTQIAGSRETQSFYYMSQAYSTDIDINGAIGDGITRRRRAPVLMNELLRINHHNFWLFMEVGTANADAPGDDPTMLLQWSNDGGHTFNAGESKSIGTFEAWNTLVRWWMLGQARQRVYQLTCSAPIPLRLVDAYVNHSLGAS